MDILAAGATGDFFCCFASTFPASFLKSMQKARNFKSFTSNKYVIVFNFVFRAFYFAKIDNKTWRHVVKSGSFWAIKKSTDSNYRGYSTKFSTVPSWSGDKNGGIELDGVHVLYSFAI